GSQQREKGGGKRRHAGCKTDRGAAAFHLGNLAFQRRRGGRALARIAETRLTLEYSGQLARVLVCVLRRKMQGLVYGPVLDMVAPVGVQNGSGKAVLAHDGIVM